MTVPIRVARGLALAGIALLVAQSAASEGAADWLKRGQEVLGALGGDSKSLTVSDLTDSEIGSGLKEALRVGTETVVSNLGQTDGFNANEIAHIALPDTMEKVQKTLDTVGMSSLLDDLELKLNRAAEAATPRAKELFWGAIEEMTLDDVQAIYSGGDNAATQYFQGKMSAPLREEMRPIVDSTLAEVGAVQAFDQVMGQYQQIPFVPDVKADLSNHVLDRGLEAIFHYVAEEEAAIRSDPAKQTTDLLRKVFGG